MKNWTDQDANFMGQLKFVSINVTDPKPTRRGLSVYVSVCPFNISASTQISITDSTTSAPKSSLRKNTMSSTNTKKKSHTGGIEFIILFIAALALCCCIGSLLMYRKNV